MSLVNSFFCPSCGKQFPIWVKPSQQVRRGFFSKPDFKCQHCGQTCRSRIDFTSALIAWPITALYTSAMLYAVQTEFFREFRKDFLLLYIPFVWLFILAPFFLGLRRGLKLIKAQNESVSKKSTILKGLTVVITTAVLILFGYYSKDWSNVIIGVVVGIVIYLFYNHFRQKE